MLKQLIGGLSLALFMGIASASIVTLPRQLVVDANGDVRSGAKLYIYAAGTTTPLTLYTTNALSATQSNPVVSSSSGLFAAVYLASTVSTYKIVLKDSSDVTIYTEDNIPAGSLSQSEIGASFYPETGSETSAGSTIIRYWYPPGNLKRYTENDGDGSTDVSDAFTTMLSSGEGCDIPVPESSWAIASTVTWVSGVYCDAHHGSFTSTVGSGNWTFLFDGVPYGSGAGFKNFILNISNAGAKGIQLWESRDVLLSDFEILGPSGIGGYGIEINGGDDASATYGSAHNFIENCRVYRMAAGLRLYTDNTTTPADTTAFANRNFVFGCQLQTNTEGLSMDRAATNEIYALSLQANTEGADIGQYARKNTLCLIPENNTRAIVLHTSSTDNLYCGTVQHTDFVNSGGTAVDPQLTNKIVSAQDFMLPRNIVVPDGGSIRLDSPYDTGPIRVRLGDTYDYDLYLSSHDSADANFDLIGLKYNATAPYTALLRNAAQTATTITYSASMNTDASLGKHFVITATNGTAFTINAPTNPVTGYEITYTIRNTSGGALGAVTWDSAFKLATWTSPATANSRSITFKYNGTNWVEISRTPSDVPN